MDALNPVETALARQEECRRMLYSGHDRYGNGRTPTSILAETKVTALASHIDRAALYWWADPIAQTVLAASRSMPDDWILTAESVPSLTGLWVFERPLPVLQDPPPELATMGGIDTIEWDSAVLRDGHTEALVLGSFFERQTADDGQMAYRGMDTIHWEVGTPIVDPNDRQRPEADYQIPHYTYDFCRFLAAGLQFLAQQIIVSEPQTLPRAERRRWERERPGEPPTVRIVALRQVAAEHHTAEEARPVDWQVRWLVSGHWRRQWHPSLKHHQPRFILPHIKGPGDKPLRVRPTVYAVKR